MKYIFAAFLHDMMAKLSSQDKKIFLNDNKLLQF